MAIHHYQRVWRRAKNTGVLKFYLPLVPCWRIAATLSHRTGTMLVHETTPWYDKHGELTFADMIVAIRRSIGTKQHFSKSTSNEDFLKFTAQEIAHLISQLSLEA